MFEKLLSALVNDIGDPSGSKKVVKRAITGKVLRFGAFGSRFETYYNVLVESHPQPLRIYPNKEDGPPYLELTMPGDVVTLSLNEDGDVISFVNPMLPK